MAKVNPLIYSEFEKVKEYPFASEAEEKRYRKVGKKWTDMHQFMQVRSRVSDPNAYAKMARVELDRETGPRATIVKRLIGKHYKLIQQGVIDEALKADGVGKPKPGKPRGRPRKVKESSKLSLP